jgi:hypothetical protein
MRDDRLKQTTHDADALIERMKELSDDLRNSAKEIELHGDKHGNQRNKNSNAHSE